MIVACGTHRFDATRRQTFERALADGCGLGVESFVWHDCRSPDLRFVTPAGLWRACPELLDGDAPLLAVGSVEPHYFAGLTGAHKTVTIGCADFDAIQANHANALSPDSRPFATAGNPVHDGVAEMVRQLESVRPVHAVNVVQTGETIRAISTGKPLAALAALTPVAREVFAHTLDAPADALILDVEGPLGESFYQADKALKNAEDAVRDGGALILCAECRDGIGQDHFVALLRDAPTYRQAVERVFARGYRLGDHKAVRLRRLTDLAERAVRVLAVCPGLDDAACDVLGFHKASSVADALRTAGVGAGDRVWRVGDAGNTVVLPGPDGRN
jgi:nickel-dependent lactate racemase